AVDHLDRAGGVVQFVRSDAERFAGGVAQQGANAFAATENGVTHGFVERRRCRRGGGKAGVQRVFDAVDIIGHAGLETGHAVHVWPLQMAMRVMVQCAAKDVHQYERRMYIHIEYSARGPLLGTVFRSYALLCNSGMQSHTEESASCACLLPSLLLPSISMTIRTISCRRCRGPSH